MTFNVSEFNQKVLDVFDEEEKKNGESKMSSDFFLNLKTPVFPPMVQVGISNLCDLSCGQCYHKAYKKKKGYCPVFMKQTVFRKVVDETASFPTDTVFRFLGKGESLLHPELIEMLAYARNTLAQPIAFITNGIRLDQEMGIKLLATGVDVIDVSIDAFSRDVYGMVRSNSNWFPLLVENVETLIDQRNKGGFKTRIFVSFLIQPENYLELDQFEAFWENKADKILFRKYHTYGGLIGKKPTPYRERTPCAALWGRINVNERGRITRCFVDWNDTDILADIRKVSLLEAWRSSAYAEIRKQHLKAVYSGICANCEGWQSAHWNLSYEKAVNTTGGEK